MTGVVAVLMRIITYIGAIKPVLQAVWPAVKKAYSIYLELQKVKESVTMATLKVQVNDNLGVGLAGVGITCGDITGTTDANGLCTLSGLTANVAVVVSAALSGYASNTGTETPLDNPIKTVTIVLTATESDTSTDDTTTSVTSAIVSAAAAAVVPLLDTSLASIKAKVQAKIDSTHSWTQLEWRLLLLLLDIYGDKYLAKAKAKLGLA